MLILDEVQNIVAEARRGAHENATIVECLGLINDGRLGAPVILLAGGLGTSKNVLESLGVSRLTKHTVRRIGRLDEETTEAIIRDWLVQCGGAQSNHEYLEQWIHALAERTFGWPQHIQCYAEAAALWLLDNGHALTPEVPAEVLAQGLLDADEYCQGRTSTLRKKDLIALADLLERTGKNCSLDEDGLIKALSENRTQEAAQQKFDDLLHKGVIAETSNRDLIVPVPSMHDWIVHNFANTTQSLPPKSANEQLRARDTLRSQRD